MQAALSGWTLPAGTAAICLLVSLTLGTTIAWVVASLHRRWRRAARQLALALLVPGVALAFRPEWLLDARDAGARSMSMVLGQVRAASGLGAGRIAILRLVWLPQLGPAALLGALLAGLLDLAALALRR